MPKYSFEDIRPPRSTGNTPATPAPAPREIRPEPPRLEVPHVARVEKRAPVEPTTPLPERAPVRAPEVSSRITTPNIGRTISPKEPLLLTTYTESDRRFSLGRGPRIALWVIAGGVVLFLGSTLGNVLGGATVTVSLKSEKVTLSKPFIAKVAAGAGEVPVSTMSIVDEASDTVPYGSERTVHEKAHGTIVVYNTIDGKPQRLIKNTRFETPAGLIYRAESSIEIPGAKNNGTIPGTVEVNVVADDTGEKYNGAPTDFTIPGFKGDPKFEKFYGRGKTPMTGGFDGVKKEVSDADVLRTNSALEATLKEKLLARARTEKGEDALMFDDGVATTFEHLSVQDDNGKGRVTVRGTLTAFLLPQKSFMTQITLGVDSLKNVDVEMKEDSTTLCTFPDKIDFIKKQALTVQCKGDITLVRVLDMKSFAARLTDASRSSFQSIVNEFPAIKDARATVAPVWRRSFPSTSSDIKVIIE